MANEIVKETLHPDNNDNIDIYPKTSYDQVEGRPNLENGTGTGSLVQKTVSSSGTPYNNHASGSGAIALGKNTKALGNTDFVIGQDNTDNSSGSFVGGSNCNNTGNYAFVFGRYLKNTQIGAVRLGSYNKNDDFTAFSIGIGDVDNRKNGLEYDAYTNTLLIPTGNILYGTNLRGNNANFSGEVKIGNKFIGSLGGKSVLRVGSYDITPDVSGFEVDLSGNTTFLGKLKSLKTPVNDEDVVRLKDLKANTCLYMHNIKLNKATETYAIQYPSSKNTNVTNLTELKVLLNNNTTTPVMVLDSNNNGVGNTYLSTSSMNIIMWTANGKTSISLSGYTVTDTIIKL